MLKKNHKEEPPYTPQIKNKSKTNLTGAKSRDAVEGRLAVTTLGSVCLLGAVLEGETATRSLDAVNDKGDSEEACEKKNTWPHNSNNERWGGEEEDATWVLMQEDHGVFNPLQQLGGGGGNVTGRRTSWCGCCACCTSDDDGR